MSRGAVGGMLHALRGFVFSVTVAAVAAVIICTVLIAAVAVGSGVARAEGPSVPVVSAGPSTPLSRPVRVAAISFEPVKRDLRGNATKLQSLFREASTAEAQLAVAPEGALDGYLVNEIIAGDLDAEAMRAVAITMGHPILREFQALADELDLCIVFGFAERVGDDVFNTAVFMDDRGTVRGKYHKMQFAEGYHPDWWFNRPGREARAFDTPFGRCGILICNDRWNPDLARILRKDGAQLLVVPSYGSVSPQQDEAVLARARENGVPLVQANVGLTLVANRGEVVAVRRERSTIMLADIEIPMPVAVDAPERDRLERAFLEWRDGEMSRRYQQRMRELEKPPAR
jgi:predicted amidohydrolase